MKPKLLKIRQVGDKILKQIAQPVTEITPELQTFFRDLLHTMYETEGVGLAAPQVGVPLRIYVYDTDWNDEDGKKNPHIVINPRMIRLEGEQFFEEGCLSVPNIYEKVKRYNFVEMEYMDEKGQMHTIEAEGPSSVVLQHEYDHLEGILFIDKLPKLKLWPLKKKLRLMESSIDEEGNNYRG